MPPGITAEKNMKVDSWPMEIQQEIIEKTKPPLKWSMMKISEWLVETYGDDFYCSNVTLSKWVKRRQATMTAAIYGSKEFKENTNKMYSHVLSDYFDVLSRLMDLEKELCRTRKIKVLQKVKVAGDLFESIRQGVLSGKDMIVGDVGTEGAVMDVEQELERLGDDPILQVIAEK